MSARIHACKRAVFLLDRQAAKPLCSEEEGGSKRVGAVCVVVGGKSTAQGALAQLEKQAREMACPVCAKLLADLAAEEIAATARKLGAK